MEIRAKLRDWYLGNKRDLPWRETRDPYLIWVSEVILQQTRVNQGLDYYLRFTERFPDVRSLAEAEEQEVLKVWEGLGYYSRARNMLEAARMIVSGYGGEFPDHYEGLLELKGIGPYTASAVSSIAFSEPRAVLDGNVHRVLSRLLGIGEAPGGYSPSSKILKAANEILDREDPGTHNQAVMELGALICTPRNPSCPSCPLREDCRALKTGRVDELPVRKPQTTRKIRYFHYMVLRESGAVYISRRREGDIWEGLYEFPLIESGGPLGERELLLMDPLKNLPASGLRYTGTDGPRTHLLSHQEIRAFFHRFKLSKTGVELPFTRIDMSDIGRFPMPKLILNYLEDIPD